MAGYTVGAEPIAREPGEKAVVLGDLCKLRPPDMLTATVADGREPGDTLGSYDVGTMPVMLKAHTFAAVAFWAAADTDLVELAVFRAGRDDPAPGALVGAKYLFAVELEESEPSKDVGGGLFGGVGVRWVR